MFSEKPMAETLADARDLVARAKAAGRIHAVVQNRRYLAVCAASRGRCGRTRSRRDHRSSRAFFLAPHFGGFREEVASSYPVARHGDLQLRRLALHDRIRAASCVHCREWNSPQSWYRQAPRRRAIFEAQNGSSSSIAAHGARKGCPRRGNARGASGRREGALTCNGSDEIRIEVLDEANARASSTHDHGRAPAARAGGPGSTGISGSLILLLVPSASEP